MSTLRPKGGYRTTCSFQTATIIYDATWWFCEKFLDSRSRTVDQMPADQQRWALYSRWLDHDDPAIRANATICLIHQANYLLDQQIGSLERAFIDDGGYSEQLATARLAARQRKKDQSGTAVPAERIPVCPQCGKPTVLRTAKSGKNSGKQFWGCTAYPDCKGVVNL